MTLQKVSQIFTKILLLALQTKLFHIVFLAIFLTIGNNAIYSQEIKPIKDFEKEKKVTPIKEETKLIQNDTSINIIKEKVDVTERSAS